MANRFLKLKIKPDLLISSPANRALTTAKGHAQAMGISMDQIVQDERHYHASSQELRELIQEVNDEHECIMIFGHNPGLTYLINELCNFNLDNLPTCAICGIEFNISSWSYVSKGLGEKFYYDFPKAQQ